MTKDLEEKANKIENNSDKFNSKGDILIIFSEVLFIFHKVGKTLTKIIFSGHKVEKENILPNISFFSLLALYLYKMVKKGWLERTSIRLKSIVTCT